MTVESTRIDGLLVVAWPTHDDDRGFFRQTHQTTELEQVLGRAVAFVQGNHARSMPNVIRGLHAEPWDKLLHVAHGTAFIAVADIRPDSPTFASVETFVLGDLPGLPCAVFIANGLANSYATVGDQPVDVVYDVSAEWHPVDKRAIAWDDPDLAIEWPTDDPLLSDDDRANPTLRERFPDHPRFTETD